MTTISCDYLLIGGGGGGASSTLTDGGGGGGGAGKFIESFSVALVSGNSYGVTVGTGGSSNINGTDTVFNGITATHGNRGEVTLGGGGNGGVGGNSGQPYSGGTYFNSHAGAGAGSGSNGGNATSGAGGTGGTGTASTILGRTLAGGGGGGDSGAGGTGGGGAGSAYVSNSAGFNATDYGSGGGGAGTRGVAGTSPGGAGYQGIVVIRYLSAMYIDGSGGTISHSGGYTIHTFTSGGTFIAPTISPAGLFAFFY